MSGHANGSSHLAFDWHTPSMFSDHSVQRSNNNEAHLAPGRCETAHFSLNTPHTPGLCCWDWFNRQRQLTEGVSPTGYSVHTHTHTHTHTHSLSLTQPQTPPLLRTHSLTGLTSTPCPLLPQYKSDFSREHTHTHTQTHTQHYWITLFHPRSHLSTEPQQKPHRAQQHGEQLVMCPPAQLQILQ